MCSTVFELPLPRRHTCAPHGTKNYKLSGAGVERGGRGDRENVKKGEHRRKWWQVCRPFCKINKKPKRRMAPCSTPRGNCHEARRQTLNANIIFLLNKRGGKGGRGAVAGLLAVAVWLICASHKKFNFISPFLISYSARRIWRKQSTLDDNNYDAPDPGFQIQGPVRKPEPWENNAKKSAWLALYLYIFFSLSLLLFWHFVSLLPHAACASNEKNKQQIIQSGYN